MAYRKLFLVGMLMFSWSGLYSVAYSATFYLSPSGSNTSSGSSVAPWKTFSFAIPKLKSGDVLILKDGIYDSSNSGLPVIDCNTSSANNGTSTNPITIKAENERQAFLSSNGSVAAVRIFNCFYWAIEGLRAKSTDNSGSTVGDVFDVRASSNLSFKRLLLTHNNRVVNSHLLSIQHSDNILVEESEFYFFHRHAILAWYTNNSNFRRNYFNSRGQLDVLGGYQSASGNRGENGISIYPGSNNISENNISEGNLRVVSVRGAYGQAVGNKSLGDISLNDVYGFAVASVGSHVAADTTIENLAVLNPTYYGIITSSAKNTKARNISLFGGQMGILSQVDDVGDGVFSISTVNVLVMNHSSCGIRMVNQTTWSHDYTNAYNNAMNFNPTTNVKNVTTLNPGLGACRVFVPANSPLKGKGAGGADIGANILYRYEKGVLTNQPLWNTKTGQFPHGALVPGVNDIAGSSAFDVHKRLNVNINGCMLPENYGAGEPDLTPMNLRRVVTSG